MIYGNDSIGKDCFAKLACDKKRIPQLNQKIWRIVIKGFSRGMKWKCYLALSFGIKQLLEHRVEEKLSDTYQFGFLIAFFEIMERLS